MHFPVRSLCDGVSANSRELPSFCSLKIPLAKKLKDCGVFGVSSDEYLQYAQQNRKEWELKGKQIVAEMMETLEKRSNK